MSIKKVSKKQPGNFEFNSNNLEIAKKIILNFLQKDIGLIKMKFILLLKLLRVNLVFI